ncbi:MAG: hypothetical protein V4671_01385, partial [Armatimonadota bacterium]
PDVTVNGQSGSSALQSRLSSARFLGEDTRPLEKANELARDWLLPDAPSTAARIVSRLSKLAGTPGLAGIALTDLLAPGYRIPAGEASFFTASYSDMGYTPTRRIAAIKAFGCDPVDIVLNRGYVTSDAPGPFLIEGTAQQIGARVTHQLRAQKRGPGEKSKTDDLATLADASPLSAWNALRFRAGNDLLDRIYSTLSKATKGQPESFSLYLQNIGDTNRGWFGTWDQRDKLPLSLDYQEGENYTTRIERSARSASMITLYRHPYIPSEDPNAPFSTTDTPPLPPGEKYAVDFSRAFRQGPRSWDGFVFDLRDMTLEKALEVLQGIAPPVPPARKSAKQ